MSSLLLYFLSWFTPKYLRLLDRYNIGVVGYMCGTLYNCDLEDRGAFVYAHPSKMVESEKCVGECCDGYRVRILFEKVEVVGNEDDDLAC